jgi:ABC-type multidrug transport system ATPase subunit
MVAKPSVLVLDEPTSGLDSHKAGTVVKVLKRLADSGCTIIFTIHQPSYLLYSMLTKLILLDKGMTIYQGKAQEIGTYIK